MTFLKVKSLLTIFGQADYKGLNIDQFVSGSQRYAHDLSYCVLATNEIEIPSSPDLSMLTQNDYLAECETIKANKPPSEATQLEQAKAEITSLQAAVDTLILDALV